MTWWLRWGLFLALFVLLSIVGLLWKHPLGAPVVYVVGLLGILCALAMAKARRTTGQGGEGSSTHPSP